METPIAPLTISGAARLLGCSTRTVSRLIRDGSLGYLKLSQRRVAIPAKELDRYLESRFQPPRDIAPPLALKAGRR